MYDKVRLFLPKCRGMPDISQYLGNGGEKTNIVTGETNVYGFINNLRINQFVGGYVVSGSLSGFLYDNNLYPLDYHTTAKAIEKLSDSLHLEMRLADVLGLEFGTNFVMEKAPKVYLDKLGDMPRKVRVQGNTNTLYYQGVSNSRMTRQKKVLAFYDKIADAQSKGMRVPTGLEQAHLLRYELRLNGRLSRQIGVQEVKASTLSDKVFFKKLLKMWSNDYFSITKHHTTKTEIMSEIKTPGDAINVFIARLMSKQDKDEIATFVEELKSENIFDDAKYYSRVKKKLKELSSNANLLVTDADIKELDDAIINTIANA